MHFTRKCSDSIKVRWPKVQSFASSFCLMLHAKNYSNQPMLHGAIQKKSGTFFMDHGVDHLVSKFLDCFVCCSVSCSHEV